MKNSILLLIAALVFLPATMFAQSSKMLGKWYSIDEDGNRKSMVLITKNSNGVYEGTIEKLLTGDPERRCVECTGADKNKPIKGLKIIKSLREDGSKLSGGTILDPANGKTYTCTISYDSKSDNLKLRGSLDRMGIIGRNQTWLRAKD